MFKKYLKFWRNMFNYKGSTNVYEYWMTILSVIVINLVLHFIFLFFLPTFLLVIETGYTTRLEAFVIIILIFILVYILAMPLCLGALISRRLRDAGKSRKVLVLYYLFMFIAIIPLIIIIYAGSLGSKDVSNASNKLKDRDVVLDEKMPINEDVIMEQNIFCRICGIGLNNDSKYCRLCGTQIITDLNCNTCGLKNTYDSTYCRRCGNYIGGYQYDM